MPRPLYRNSIVHMTKEVTKGTVTARCGTTFKQYPYGTKDKAHGTMFESRITCPDCRLKPPVLPEIEW